MSIKRKMSVYLLQQGVWDMPLESMPLASGYLKAMALANDRLREHTDIRIRNFQGGVTLMKMAREIFRDGAPDVLAFSVLGWNYREFGALAETFKSMNPDGLVIFGGTHVANNAERTFRMFPDVDVVVNGEGEFVFVELLEAYLEQREKDALSDIAGISFTNTSGQVVTTEARGRINDLDVIPSPFLTGAIDLVDELGKFKYDVALMETNRGCPYKCSFCYWGGAIGQRVRAFSRERLRAEIDLFAKLQVHTVVLCDANFGMLPSDRDFVSDLIEAREKHGYPRALETSWAKNKSKVFYDIVRTMKQAGLRSSFTLALQTVNEDALSAMNRRNMKVNEWKDLSEWLDREGLDSYAELIWGAPGETVETFMDGYDRLSHHVSRIAVYPLHLLPNTEYAEKKSEYGIISVRGDRDDFEYILAHDTVSFQDNEFMKHFLFWSRVIAENAVLRNIWVGLRQLSGVSQSQVLRDLSEWVNDSDDPAALPLRAAVTSAVDANSDVAYGDAVSYLFGNPDARRLLEQWWSESIRPLLPPDSIPLLDEIFRYDILTMPHYHHPKATSPPEELPVVTVRGERYFVRRVALSHDIPTVIASLRAGEQDGVAPSPTEVDLYYRAGAENFVGSTNHEEVIHFVGMTRDEALTVGASTAEEAGSGVNALLVDKGGCS